MIDFPASPTVGQTFTAAGVTWTYDGAKWTLGPSAPNLITVSDTPPPNPSQGALWWESVNGQTYVFYNDGSSSQWAPTTNQMGGGYLPKQGVTDGSDAPPGQLGEVISNVNTTGSSIPTSTPRNVAGLALTAGDWDVFGEIWFTPAGATMTSVVGALTPTSSTFPTVPDMSVARQQLIGLSALGVTIVSLACRASLTAATTYYLVCQVNFTGGTSVTPTGKIWARRAR